MLKNVAIVLSVALALSACGGGGEPVVDNSKAITQALDNIGNSIPDPKPAPYTGGVFSINGGAATYIPGTSEDMIVGVIGNTVLADVVQYADWYKPMLSDAGLIVVTYYGKHVYSLKVGKDGKLVVTLTVK